jgi:CDP-diacylglycerol--serine O-phosphatidyltransferase
METNPRHEPPAKEPPVLKIYFLPNLLTAGNLLFGFMALNRIVEAEPGPGGNGQIKVALAFILLACICDLLDGRVARMGGVESPFGREFDSLADLISFGAAPAFLVNRVVLQRVFTQPEIGWFISSIYLICGALRLARFNCLAATPGGGGGKEFMGFPIPAAAGLVASLTLFLMWDEEKTDLSAGPWRYLLPGLLLFLSVMMVSEVKYPSFKTLDLRARRTFAKTAIIIIFVAALVILRRFVLPIALPIMFTTYLLYGFIRPRISRKVRDEIEEEEEDDETPPH